MPRLCRSQVPAETVVGLATHPPLRCWLLVVGIPRPTAPPVNMQLLQRGAATRAHKIMGAPILPHVLQGHVRGSKQQQKAAIIGASWCLKGITTSACVETQISFHSKGPLFYVEGSFKDYNQLKQQDGCQRNSPAGARGHARLL